MDEHDRVLRAFTVGMAATTDLVTCGPDERADEVRKRSREFDVVPVLSDDEVVGVLDGGREGGELVRDRMLHLRSSMFAAARDALIEVLVSIDRTRFKLVVEDHRVMGIFTLSDLQRQPVRPLLFALVSEVERQLAAWLRRRCAENDEVWLSRLAPARRGRIGEKYRELRAENLAVSLVSAAQFADKRDAAIKLGAFGERSKKVAESDLKVVERLRDRVAHGIDYASTAESALETIAAIRLANEYRQVLSVRAA